MVSLRARPLVLLAALALPAAPAVAQSIPADQSCGGLLCDMGVLGHKVEPPASAAPVVAPAPATASAAGAPAIEPPRARPRLARKTLRAPRTAAVPAPAVKAPRPAPVVAREAPVVLAAPVREAAPAPAEAPPPRYTGPTVIFQSIDPRFQLDP